MDDDEFDGVFAVVAAVIAMVVPLALYFASNWFSDLYVSFLGSKDYLPTPTKWVVCTPGWVYYLAALLVPVVLLIKTLVFKDVGGRLTDFAVIAGSLVVLAMGLAALFLPFAPLSFSFW